MFSFISRTASGTVYKHRLTGIVTALTRDEAIDCFTSVALIGRIDGQAVSGDLKNRPTVFFKFAVLINRFVAKKINW